MGRVRGKYVNIKVDRLTNSIENTLTGEVFETEIIQLKQGDNKQISKKDWVFDWEWEMKSGMREIFKLTTTGNPNVIQGLLSIEDKKDHIYMHLIETAKFNKGKNKMYIGVPGNLVAYACKISFEKGYEGYIAFEAKSTLIKHYEQSLGATHFRGLTMFIDSKSAIKLIQQYFKNE